MHKFIKRYQNLLLILNYSRNVLILAYKENMHITVYCKKTCSGDELHIICIHIYLYQRSNASHLGDEEHYI